jgi:hypothetical protein
MRILLCLAIALGACQDPSGSEIEKPEPPHIRVQSAVVDHRKSGTVVEMILKNDGSSGVFKLTFWAKYEESSSVARETSPRYLSSTQEVEYHWAITRDGSHVVMDSVQVWSAFRETETWVLTDTYGLG